MPPPAKATTTPVSKTAPAAPIKKVTAVPTKFEKLSSAVALYGDKAGKQIAKAVEGSKFEPLVVRAQNGVIEIIARIGNTLIYLEASLSEGMEKAKVWTIGMYESGQKRVIPYVQAPMAKVKALYAAASSKSTVVYTEAKLFATAKYSLAQEKAFSICTPYWTKAKD